MVARAEDCFLGKEPGLGSSSSSSSLLKLSGSWRWSQGVGGGGVREGDALHSGSSFLDASRSGGLPTWTNHPSGMPGLVVSKGLHNGSIVQSSVRNNASSVGSESQDQNEGVLTSVVSSYLMAQSQQAAAATMALPSPATVTATLAPGRAGVVSTTTALAPGGSLARNSSFESINTGSCSTPSFCVGSPATVFPSRPSDVMDRANKLFSGSDLLLSNKQLGGFAESRVHAQSQLSDHYLSNDSLSYGSMEERDAIVNCVDDFWTGTGEPSLLPEFRFEPMLDDTADTGACGLSFSVGELDSLVSTSNGPPRSSVTSHRVHPAPLSPMIAGTMPAPDFCQSFFAGVEEQSEQKPIASSSAAATGSNNKPTQLAIPTRGSLLPAFAYDHSFARRRWSDEPFLPASTFSNPPSEKSPTGSSPSSPTTPLDPHLFASSKLTELQGAAAQTGPGNSTSNKRSFVTMQSTSSEKAETSLSLPLRLHGGAAANADKFDAAALSALLYSNTQINNQEFRSAYSFKDTTTAPSVPAPKQRRRHGTATDPQSIAARTRREKFTDRIRVLQSLVPNGERLDTVHMLSQTFEYVRFLQHKVWDLYNGKDSLSEVKCEKWKEFVDTATGQVIV